MLQAVGLLIATLVVCSSARASDVDFAIVVHPSNPVSRISRDDLERIYRRTLLFWPDGRRIVAINAPFGTPLRDAFRRRILRSTPDALATFWNRRYFDGVLPPPVLRSVEAIRAYVAKRPEAIGYLPRDRIDDSVKPIEVTNAR
ncbi:MAG: hypothetical protein D6760_10705 [Deltaproteobacteria bacterium]|nr:MAG: hypothetical protein D6760_10705 [Deltaproteobacteria bacterium]